MFVARIKIDDKQSIGKKEINSDVQFALPLLSACGTQERRRQRLLHQLRFCTALDLCAKPHAMRAQRALWH